MVDLEWYRSFVAIYRTGTVSAASTARYLTQPAVSQHLAALESAIGHALFRRTPRRMIPTEHGQVLYQSVVQAVDTLEGAAHQWRSGAATHRIVVRVGAPLEYGYEVVLEKLRAAPFQLHFEFGIAEQLIEKLDRGALDLVVATQQIPARSLEYRKLEEERFLLVSAPVQQPPRRAKRAADYLPLLENWLRAQAWISYSVELPLIRRYWQQVFGGRPPFQAAFVMPNLHAIRKAVELGYGVSVLPEYMCAAALKSGKLRLVWTPAQAVVNDLWIAYRKVDRRHHAIEPLRELLNRGMNSQ